MKQASAQRRQRLQWSCITALTALSSWIRSAGCGGSTVKFQYRLVAGGAPPAGGRASVGVSSPWPSPGGNRFARGSSATNISRPVLAAEDDAVDGEGRGDMGQGMPLCGVGSSYPCGMYEERSEKESDSSFPSWLWFDRIRSFGGSFLDSNIYLGLAIFSSWSGAFLGLVESYRSALEVFPIFVKSITAGFFGGCGDMLAQYIENRFDEDKSGARRRGRYDMRRMLSVVLEGMFVSGPLMHFSYEFFESVLPIHPDDVDPTLGDARLPCAQWAAVLAHVLADTVIMDSVFVFTLMATTALIEGRASMLWTELRMEYAPAVRASWMSSTGLAPVQFGAFRFLPVELRVFAMNLQDVVWNAVVSYMAHRSRK